MFDGNSTTSFILKVSDVLPNVLLGADLALSGLAGLVPQMPLEELLVFDDDAALLLQCKGY